MLYFSQYGRAVVEEVRKLPVTEVPRGRRRLDFFTQVAALLHRCQPLLTLPCCFGVLLMRFRYCLDNLRNPSLARAKLLQKFVMGIFIGLLYLRVSLILISKIVIAFYPGSVVSWSFIRCHFNVCGGE